MVDFNFIVDDDILAFFIISSSSLNDIGDLKNVKEKLYLKHKKEYTELRDFILNNNLINMKEMDLTSYRFLIEAIKSTVEFNQIKIETNKYMELIKKYWNTKKKDCNEYLSEVLRTNYNTTINTYVVHPTIKWGFSYGNNNVCWGHEDGIEDLNYNVVYLIHEALHNMLPYQKDYEEKEVDLHHAIIELITDNELYYRLSGKDTYDIGHPYLKEIKKQIIDDWKEYLNDKNANIHDFINYERERLKSFKSAL